MSKMSDPRVYCCVQGQCKGDLEYVPLGDTVEHYWCEECGILYSLEEVEDF